MNQKIFVIAIIVIILISSMILLKYNIKSESSNNYNSSSITKPINNLYNIPINNSYILLNTTQSRIAIIQSTFTEAAYNNAFYVFYAKHRNDIPNGFTVTKDLDLLTSKLDRETYLTQKDNHDIEVLQSHIRVILPNSTVTKLRDQDVTEGHLFINKSTNAFDTVIITHEEYLTQNMYDDYKHFVLNGGVIVFLDGNYFYAEVKYNKEDNSITLVKGHGYQFDGTSVNLSEGERWFNDSRIWTGSNFWSSPNGEKMILKNNIFNYTTYEENYVNNLNDIILVDYGAYTTSENTMQKKIAVYVLDYGKGQVIGMGLYSQQLLENKKFLDFFDVLISYAVDKTSTHTQQVEYDLNGIPIVYYGNIIGHQRNPITTSYALIRNCDSYSNNKNSTTYQHIKNNANWLVANTKNYGNYSLFEYKFPYLYNLTPPWNSAFAQALAIQSLTKAYQITYNGTYLSTTKLLLNSLYVDIKDGGVTEKTSDNGWWYEEYAKKDGVNPRVLNGMMYTVLSLYDYYDYTGDAHAKFLFNQGILALKNNIAQYDGVNGSSYYDSTRTVLASPYYRQVHADLTAKLYEITGEPIFKEYHDKWKLS